MEQDEFSERYPKDNFGGSLMAAERAKVWGLLRGMEDRYRTILIGTFARFGRDGLRTIASNMGGNGIPVARDIASAIC